MFIYNKQYNISLIHFFIVNLISLNKVSITNFVHSSGVDVSFFKLIGKHENIVGI